MNTSALSARVGRQGLRTVVGAMLHRAGTFLEKLWSLSGRVSPPAMVCPSDVAHLPRGMTLSLDQTDGVTRLEIVSGMVWVTDTPASGDVILRPGEAYELGDRWPYVIEALADAEFVATGAHCQRWPSTSTAT